MTSKIQVGMQKTTTEPDQRKSKSVEKEDKDRTNHSAKYSNAEKG